MSSPFIVTTPHLPYEVPLIQMIGTNLLANLMAIGALTVRLVHVALLISTRTA